jgi:hypothetical protein
VERRPIYLAEGSLARITSFGIEMVPSVKPIRILEVERGVFCLRRIMTKITYYPPEYMKDEFNCAHCRVFAHQIWVRNLRGERVGVTVIGSPDYISEDLSPSDLFTASKCEHCNKWSIWIEESLVYPAQIIVEDPNDDMPDEVKKLYRESAQVLSISPRAAAALLRLGLQILLGSVGADGKNINNDIKKIVALGVEPETQRALDILRVFGNNGAHPGEIKLDEDPGLVIKMYELMNYITDRLITQKDQINELFEGLPEGIKAQIELRDNKKKEEKS